MIHTLPDEPHKWADAAKNHSVLHVNIHSLDIVDSASKIKDQQFYALRVLWKKQNKLLSSSDLCDETVVKEAETFLGRKQAWKDYLKDIEENTGSSSLSTIEDIGTYSLVRYNQMLTYLSPMANPDYQVTNDDVESVVPKVVPSPIAHRTRGRRPISAPSGHPLTPTPMSRFRPEEEQLNMSGLISPLREIEESSFDMILSGSNGPPSPESPANPAENLPSEDEQIVNMALMLFLQGVTIHHPKIKRGVPNSLTWTMKRLQLKFGAWEARTDGYLKMAGENENVRAILETKPYLRRKNLEGIQKQESAQMAAWIYRFPDEKVSYYGREGPRFRRLLISQDSSEIYLTVADYDPAYVKYISGDEEATLGKPSLMIMEQYGPWNTKNCDHMKHLGILFLAFTLHQLSNASSREDPFTDSGKHKP